MRSALPVGVRVGVLIGALVALMASGGIARAQGHGGAAAPEGPVTIDARALDYSAMLRSQHGQPGAEAAAAEPIALANRPLRAVVRTPGAASRSLPRDGAVLTTDADGRFRMELGEVGPGATVHFFVEHAAEEGDAAGYYARPWEVDGGEPLDDVRFFEVSIEGRGVRQRRVMQVVTAVEEGDVGSGGKSTQIRHLAFVQNLSFGVWLGDLSSGQPVSYSIPVPAGFELRDVRVDGQPVEPTVAQTPHGGASFVYNEALFPTVPGSKEAYVFSAILIGPYADGDLVDISWHTELPLDDYGLSLQAPEFNYEPLEGAPRLQDMGEQAPMGNTPKPTHAWAAQGVPAHTNIPATFRVGIPQRPFPTRAVFITLVIVLAAVGAALLGRSLGRRAPRGDAEPPSDAPSGGPTGALADLDARLRSGEITSVEYEVRKRAALGGSPPAPPVVTAASAGGVGEGERAALREKLDEIVSRAADASQEQLRADLRTLARAIRELLG